MLRKGSLLVLAAALLGALLFSAEADAGANRTYVVLYKGNASSAGGNEAIQKAGGSVVANYSQIGVVIARSSNQGFAAKLKKEARVDGVSATEGFGVQLPDDAITADAASEAAAQATALGAFPADNLGERQWDMAQINTVEAHATTPGASWVVVGDIDTGLDYHHPDLAPNIDFSKSVSCVSGAPNTDPTAWDDHAGHGTHTAGTIAAAANGTGIVGVAPGVKLAGIKAGNDDGYFFTEAVICAFMWAANNGIHVTNNSYFADPWLFNCRNDPEQHAIWKATKRAIQYAMSQGVVVVSSMGNENIDLSKKNVDVISQDFPPGNEQERDVTNACVVIPNEIPGVIGVSANGPTGDKSFYSSYGQGVTDVVAPGGDSLQAPEPFGRVLSTFPAELAGTLPANRFVTDPDNGSLYAYLQGTSMAGPHAAGVAALILSAHGAMNPGHVASILQQTADEQPCPPNPYTPVHPVAGPFPAICRGGIGNNGFYGAGEVNAEAAVSD